MRLLSKYIILLLLLALGLEVFPQSKTLTIGKGTKTFTAVSAVGSTYKWYVDGTEQVSDGSATFTSMLTAGNFLLSAVTYTVYGCASDAFVIKVNVLDDIILNDVQAKWTVSSISLCPSNNVLNSLISVGVNITNYTLSGGETYSIVYTIDGGPPIKEILDNVNGIFTIDGSNFNRGNHYAKILSLTYGTTSKTIVDYSTSAEAPEIELKVVDIPPISNIKY
jgi:hypothetical protein